MAMVSAGARGVVPYWLRAIWPHLRDPMLFVATDEPEAILPVFRKFETTSAVFGPTASAIPDHVETSKSFDEQTISQFATAVSTAWRLFWHLQRKNAFVHHSKSTVSRRTSHGWIAISGIDLTPPRQD